MMTTHLAIGAFVIGLSSACYAPEVEDCVVTCSAGDECAGGQVCGNDGFCAAPDVAGQCATANPNPMPAQLVEVKVTVDGRGRLQLGSERTCGRLDADKDVCHWMVTKGARVTLIASPTQGYRFQQWTEACEAQTTSRCELSFAAPSQVGVKFEQIPDDD